MENKKQSKLKKYLQSIMFVMCSIMCVFGFSGVAKAELSEVAGLSVGGTMMVSEGKVQQSQIKSANGGTATYDVSTNTLILSDYKTTTSASCIQVYAMGNFIIQINGVCELNISRNWFPIYMNVPYGGKDTLTINGDGTLNLKGGGITTCNTLYIKPESVKLTD